MNFFNDQLYGDSRDMEELYRDQTSEKRGPRRPRAVSEESDQADAPNSKETTFSSESKEEPEYDVFQEENGLQTPPSELSEGDGPSRDELSQMFSDATKKTNHETASSDNSDSSSKEMSDESAGVMGNGGKWNQKMEGESSGKSYSKKDDDMNSQEVDANGTDDDGNETRFKSRKQEREKNTKTGSKTSSSSSTTTHIQGKRKKRSLWDLSQEFIGALDNTRPLQLLQCYNHRIRLRGKSAITC